MDGAKTLRSAAGIAALAFAAALPPLGQQTRMSPRVNVSGERLRPPPPPRRKWPHNQDDLDALARAETKRQRKCAKRLRDAG